MDFKWIVIPIIIFFTFGFISSTFEYDNLNYIEDKGFYSSNLYDSKDRISVKGINLNIEFVRGDNIYISNVKNAKIKGNFIEIEAPSFPFRDEIKIEIGRDYNYEKIEISGIRINLKGNINTDDLNIDGTDININSNINSKKIDVSGTGITVKGIIDTEYLNISGTNINLSLKTSHLENLMINSTKISGDIIFFEKWKNDSKIMINSLGGEMIFEIPTGLKNYLDINTNASVIINTKYY